MMIGAVDLEGLDDQSFQVNGLLKAHRRLNNLTVRGRFKVRVHAWLSIIVCQAHAVATGSKISVRQVA